MELCRNFTIEDDLVIEEPQEQFGLMLFTSDSAVKFGTQTASVTITDNDVVDIGLMQTTYTTSEAMGSVSVCVNISSAELARNVSVTLSTATAGGNMYR